MKKTIILFLCVTFYSAGIAQNNIDNINRQFDNYCNQGLYTNASNLLVDEGNKYLDQGDTLAAYELQLKNCYFTDIHLEEFFNNGLTWEGYFANWYMTISLAAWLNKTEEISSELLRILNLISLKKPELLPFYSSTLGYILYEYKVDDDNELKSTLQKSLDYINSVSPTPKLVKQYNEICTDFYFNRFFNNFENKILKRNRFDEIEGWYTYNHQYIDKLDTSIYKNEIIEYELLFVNQLIIYASAIESQLGLSYDAIEMYSKAISIMTPLVQHDKTVSQKIASCYARIASIYYILGNKTLCKEYSDMTRNYLIYHTIDFDYCEILSALSKSYFSLNHNKLAADLKFEEIITREKLGWHCSLTDWNLYFRYIRNINPQTVLEYKDYALAYASNPEGGCPYFYLEIGTAYSLLIGKNMNYKDSAESFFNMADSVFTANKEYHDKYNLSDDFQIGIMRELANHHLRLRQFHKAYEEYNKILKHPKLDGYYVYGTISSIASYLHKKDDLHIFLPKYYIELEKDLFEMLPLLGSIESDIYLANGESNLYYIPEWASWNPTDSVSVSIAYDAALLMKGLTLRYNTLSPYLEYHPELVGAKNELDRMRDSIYSISDNNTRLLALCRYELKEREILKGVNKELSIVHWKDIQRQLKIDEACIEFVKYTANSYSWCDSIPKPHYSAIVLLPNDKSPFFVDLFDEDELMDVYNLQPKSYDIDMGQILYSKLWGKLQQYLEGKSKVFFSPMGLLNLINIELLTDSMGRTALERFKLHRVSSTRNILIKDNNSIINSVVSFGGVDYEKANEYADIMNNMNTRGNWSYLHNSLTEVNQIGTLLLRKNIDATTYTGPNATESAFKKLDGTQFNVIHIATHGYYIPQSQRNSIPYFSESENTAVIQDELFYSGLILSGGQKAWIDSTFKPDNNDGILSAYEISKLDLHNVDLVVLSACETGLGDNLFDGIFGLQRAFKKAGVKSILMSLWQIDDKATSEYMTCFYEMVANGRSIQEAYRTTTYMMKEKYKDANYWASFVLLD